MIEDHPSNIFVKLGTI